MRIPIKNLSVLVTGGSSGWGLEVVNRFLQRGARLSVIDLKSERESKYRYPEDTKNLVNHLVGDVLNSQALEKLLSQHQRQLKSLDALVNCAGTRQGFNYLASFLMSQKVIELMAHNELNEAGCRGCVVQVCQMPADEDVYREQLEYHSAKVADIDEKVQKLADDLVAARIRSNTIIIPDGCRHEQFASLVQNVIEDQSIAGEVITLETEEEKFLE